MIDLTGRVLLVTGGGQGIGRQIALQAAEQGAAGVVITDFRLERAEAVAAEIEAMGSKGLALRNDVSDFTHVHSTVTAAAERFASSMDPKGTHTPSHLPRRPLVSLLT